jgi:hypothetical protein
MIIHNNIDKFHALMPVSYYFLIAISLKREFSFEEFSPPTIEFTLSKVSSGKTEDMKVHCTNARDIKIGDIESLHGIQLEIYDVSSHQLEGILYKVMDEENNAFSFFCSDFYIEIIG